MANAVGEDIEELQHLLSQSKRPRVRSILSAEIENLQKSQTGKAEKPVNAPLQVSAPVPEIRYTTLSSFSWEQDAEKVKIYIPIEDASAEKTSHKFQPWSFDLKVHDVNGKNYRCGITKLNKAIDPEKSTVSVKPKRLIVSLHKQEKGNWLDLHYKEDKLKAKPDGEKDPMAGIMDLMKNMYDEGDEEMKKTIAKAWTDARAGKKTDPLSSYGRY